MAPLCPGLLPHGRTAPAEQHTSQRRRSPRCAASRPRKQALPRAPASTPHRSRRSEQAGSDNRPGARCRWAKHGAVTTQTRAPPGDEDVRVALSGYRPLAEGKRYWVAPEEVEGRIPEGLEGTLFRNVPNLVPRNGKDVPHPFDGDGMLVRITFRRGQVHVETRQIETEAWKEEEASGRFLFNTAFSKRSFADSFPRNPLDFGVKNVSNTGVLAWDGRLYTLFERGVPYEIDMATMRTLGEAPVAGATGRLPVAGHYRVLRAPDAGGGSGSTLVLMSPQDAGRDCKVSFFELPAGGSGAARQRSVRLPGALLGFFHDFAVTEDYYVLVENPIKMDFASLLSDYLAGGASLASLLRMDRRRPTRVHLVPRHDGVRRRTFKLPPFFVFHLGNAFQLAGESGGGVVVADVVGWDEYDLGKDLRSWRAEDFVGPTRAEPTRITLDLATGAATSEKLTRRTGEFPTVSPAVAGRPHRYLYYAGGGIDDSAAWTPPQTITRLDVDPAVRPDAAGERLRDAVRSSVWHAGELCFVEEPLFVPRGEGEADGWLVATVFDGAEQRTQVVVLDADDLEAGPVASVRLPHHVPYGLHGTWVPGFCAPALQDGPQ